MMFDLRLLSFRNCLINNKTSTQIFGGMMIILEMILFLRFTAWEYWSGSASPVFSPMIPQTRSWKGWKRKGSVNLYRMGNTLGTLLQQVMKVVQSCCNIRPTIRPSAASVAHSLLDILTCAAAGIKNPQQIDEGIKTRVSGLLDTINNKSGRASIGQRLSDEETGDLRALAEQGDPTAAFLFGAAIWYDFVQVQEDIDDILLVDGEERSTG